MKRRFVPIALLGWWRHWEQAPVAGAVIRLEHRQLPLEAEDRCRDHGDLQAHARVVEQVARGEVVEAVDDDVVARHDLHDVRRVEPDRVLVDLHVRVELADRLLRRVHLRHADPLAGAGLPEPAAVSILPAQLPLLERARRETRSPQRGATLLATVTKSEAIHVAVERLLVHCRRREPIFRACLRRSAKH